MKRTRSYYLGRFRTIDQLLFMVTIFVAGMGLCMVLWSLDLFDKQTLPILLGNVDHGFLDIDALGGETHSERHREAARR